MVVNRRWQWLLACAFVSLANTSLASVTPIHLDSSVDDWDVIVRQAACDPGNDQQASANSGIDLVGTENDACFYTLYDDKGSTADLSDDELAFRVRVGGSNARGGFGGYLWIGMDVDRDGDLDAFLNVHGDGKPGALFSGELSVYEAGSDRNTSPSTSSARNPLLIATLHDDGSNFSFDTVDAITDPAVGNADINGDGMADRFVSFKVNWLALRNAINAMPLTGGGGALINTVNGGAGLTKDTVVSYTLSTSTNSNNVNSDVGGYDDNHDDLSESYQDQDAFSPPLTPSNIYPEITSGGGQDSFSVNVNEGSTAVTMVSATDANGDSLDYQISGGDDAAFFTIDDDGNLAFIAAPAYDSPQDANADNVYEVSVTVCDGRGGSDSQTLLVQVLSVASDTTSPMVVSLLRQNPQDEITHDDLLTFRVTFSETVANVSFDDFEVIGSAATTAIIDSVSAVSGAVYDITVSGISDANGTLGLTFAPVQDIADLSGNALSDTT
ncbi:MAG: cadherin repeat domain-containing protein, partial [Alcanivorax sp.]|nr:cadherin repeat domain-containing protein [Alcanivorax sp.]